MTRQSRALKTGDPAAEAELRARSIAARLQRGLPLTRQQRLWWDDDIAAALLKLGGLLAVATHHKDLNRALSDDRLSAMALGQKSADAVLDRLLGKPTERVQVASKLTVNLERQAVETVVGEVIPRSAVRWLRYEGAGTWIPPPEAREIVLLLSMIGGMRHHQLLELAREGMEPKDPPRRPRGRPRKHPLPAAGS